MSSIGATQAAGTIGTANALTSGITGATSSLSLPLYLQSLSGGQTPTAIPTPTAGTAADFGMTSPPSTSFLADLTGDG
jgi:hypothetical protein